MSELELEEKAAAGDTDAQCSLAFLYEIGLDRPQDYRKALGYWQKAAQAGRSLAIDKIKALLDEGKIQASWLENASELTSQSQRPLVKTQEILPKIIIADDEDEIRMLLASTLVHHGFQVVEASNGEEAVQKVLANPDVRLIISDLKMPKLNGLQMVKAIRRMQLAEEAKLIVLTAYSQPALIAEGKKLAIDAWLVKPVRQDALVDTVRRLLERKAIVA